VSQDLANPKESHFKVGKRILKYLKLTINVGLWYPRGALLSLTSYLDSDFVGCKLDRKNTSGMYHLLVEKQVLAEFKRGVN